MGEGVRDYRDLLVWQKAKALEEIPAFAGMTEKIKGTVLFLKENRPRDSSPSTNHHPLITNHHPLSTKLSTVLIALCALFTIHYSLFTTPAFANNLTIRNVDLSAGGDASHATIKFDISQDNSWRFSPEIRDAAWVFVKYSVDGGEWLHADISGVDLAVITGTALTFSISSDNKGVFIYRAASAEGKGALSTNGVKLQWNITFSNVDPQSHKILLRVFALEMARIPQGAFYLGSGGAESGAFYKYPTTTNPYQITSEGAITVGTATDNLYYPNPSTYSGDRAGPIPAAFPKGYQAFYIMKYDLTQGQYRDFLNTLTRVQQAARIGTTPALVSGITSVTNRYVMSNTAAISYRNGIRCDATIDTANPIIFYCDLNGNNIPNEPADGEFIACNWLSWVDLAAYADWAGLRPMTELEYEKACRGTAIPTANEYAWGSISITASASGPTNSGANNETAANSANCLYTGGVSGPMRSGFAATSSSSRYSAGASFYGVMDLSGNLWKRPVTVGNSTGRLFTGIHGNGALNTNGNADVDYWPGTDASGAGYRGGSWLHDTTCARASDRHFAALTSASRDYYYGARLARTSP